MNSQKNNQPLVSIIMNCYNGEDFLHQSIESVLSQTYKNWELIFWDNRSNDKSAEIFKSYDDERLKYYCAPEHTLLSQARNEAIKNPNIISDVSRKFGSQCMVLSIQAKWQGDHWEAYYDNGREHSYLDVIEWAKRGEELGAGEILLTSVDQEGTGKGADIELIRQVKNNINIPLVVHGGIGSSDQAIGAIVENKKISGIAISSMLHYQYLTKNRKIDGFEEEGNIEFLKNRNSFKMFGNENLIGIKKRIADYNIPLRVINYGSSHY